MLTISLLFASLYLGVVIGLHRGCTPLYQVASVFRDLFPSARFSRSSPSLTSPHGADTGAVLTATEGTT
jgi:hypothetical protein